MKLHGKRILFLSLLLFVCLSFSAGASPEQTKYYTIPDALAYMDCADLYPGENGAFYLLSSGQSAPGSAKSPALTAIFLCSWRILFPVPPPVCGTADCSSLIPPWIFLRSGENSSVPLKSFFMFYRLANKNLFGSLTFSFPILTPSPSMRKDVFTPLTAANRIPFPSTLPMGFPQNRFPWRSRYPPSAALPIATGSIYPVPRAHVFFPFPRKIQKTCWNAPPLPRSSLTGFWMDRLMWTALAISMSGMNMVFPNLFPRFVQNHSQPVTQIPCIAFLRVDRF